MPQTLQARSWPKWIIPALAGAIAFALVAAAIDPAGDYPNAPEGPGLTIDEWFNVQQGVRLYVGLQGWAAGAISLREIFNDPRDPVDPRNPDAKPEFGHYNPDHPPLGRLWLGVWHTAAATLAPPIQHRGPFITACARVGSAAAFALTVFLCGWTAARWYGVAAGTFTAIALVLMPRVFGHAHLAALETGTGLAYVGAVLAVARVWSADLPPSSAWAAITGLAVGAAMLTKIQGVLIPIPVAIWAFFHWRFRAARPLAIWGAVGLATFFLFWPWLWNDPVGRFGEYLGRSVQRSVVYVWYFGQRFADRDVPWHYPAVMFLLTVPIGLQALGIVGLVKGPAPPWRERQGQLILGAILFPLALFSVPHVTVYDGARLFLVVFPLWAIVIGRGGGLAWDWLCRKWSKRVAAIATVIFLAGQAWGLAATWPCFLSYYNGAIGGLPGASRLGLELDYWGEAVTRNLLEQIVQGVPDGAQIDVAPVLDESQLHEMIIQSPILRRRGIVLRAYGSNSAQPSAYLLVFRRMADLSPELQKLTTEALPMVEVRRSGVLLAGLYDQRAR